MNVHLMRASVGAAVEARFMPTAAAAPIPGERDGGCTGVGGARLLYDMGGGGRLYCGIACCPKADGSGDCCCSPEVTPSYAPYDDARSSALVIGGAPEVLSLTFSTSGGGGGGAISACLANAPAFQVARFFCLLLKYLFRTTKTPTARSPRTSMATMAPIAPPETPLDEDALELAALFPAEEGVAVAATVDEVLVVGVLEGVEVVEVVVVVVDEGTADDEDEDVDVGVEEVVVVDVVEVIVTAAGCVVTTASDDDVCNGRKAGSVERSPEPFSVIVTIGPVSPEPSPPAFTSCGAGIRFPK